MAVLQGALLLLTVLALCGLPCLLIAIVRIDDMFESAARTLRRRRRCRADRRCARQLLRAAGVDRDGEPVGRWRRLRPRAADLEKVGPVGPPIERIAADLRRLSRQRTGLATRSAIWMAAVQRAYDDRLSLACHQLEIPQHLAELNGMDQEIERVRMEGLLQLSGLSLRSAEVDQR